MTKKSKLMISIILALIILGGIIIIIVNNNNENSIIIKITIYPPGSESTFYFTLSQNSILRCSEGKRSGNDFNVKKFIIKVNKTAKKKLTDEEMVMLLDLVKEIEANGNDYKVVRATDTWNVALIYNNEIYETNYSHVVNEKLKELINKIKDLSPLYVNLNTFVA